MEMLHEKKKIILLVDRVAVDNYSLIDDEKYIIISHPSVAIVNGHIIKNFDFYIGNNEFKFKKYLGDSFIDMKRIPKRDQMFFAHKHNILTPKFTFMEERNFDVCSICKHVTKMIGDEKIQPNTEIVIKFDDVARGLNQVIVEYQNLWKFVNYKMMGCKKLSKEDGYYKIGGSEDENDNTLNAALSVNNSTFYERIKVKKEFRLLFNCCGDYDIVERVVNAQAGWLLNAGGNVNNNALPQEILNRFLKFSKLTGLAFGSMDIYLDENGDYGIFEWCPQFGYKSHDIQKVQMIVNNGIDNKIKYIIGKTAVKTAVRTLVI